jgi:pilus assembly protein FimV
MRIGLKSAAIAVALTLNPLTAGAAGLGKISVLSTLGQPLKAEVDVSASRDELPTLAARLAPADAFKQQGIAYGAALSGIRVAIDKRPSGQPYIRITGDRPLNEPFLELLVELSWGSGRLVREYTFLLDPPADVTQKVIATPVAPPEVKAEAKVEPKVEAQPEAKAAVAEPEKKPAPPAAVAAEARSEPKKAAAEAGEREVKRGDTLGKIAAELKPEGVNLDQMLVALFRSNQDAFDGENMNRLRAGKILKMPEREDILALDAAGARQVVVAQSADFSAYRKKLAAAVAAAPAKEEAPKQAVAGKIAPKVEDKAPVAPAGKDKLEVSRTEAAKDAKGAAAAKARIGALEEDLVARDRALKEASSRVAELEKNLGDLKKLAELKSQAGAKIQDQAGKPAVAEAKKPEPAPAKPTEAPKVVAPPPVAAAPAVPAAAAKPEEAKPAEAAKPAKPVETAKPPAPAKKPAPPPEPTFMEAYGGMLAMAGAALVTALLGFVGFTAIRRKRRANADAAAQGSALTGTDLSANSVFGSTGGQSVDTGAAMHTDFGQAAGGHDEGVDPVAEADVYMAYGRDAQAEEILIEALKTEPSRHTIHVKLLEIYSARKSVRQFETLAMDLKGQTGGSGADWEKAAVMGRAIDPSNPLYGAESAPAAPAAAPIAPAAAPSLNLASTVIFAPGATEKMQATVTMPGQLAQMAAAAEAQVPQEAASLDFDLDLGGPITEQPGAAAGTAAAPAAAPASMDFDLDLGGPAGAAAPAAAAPPAAALDIDLGLGAPAEQPAADAGIDFAMDLGAPPAAPPVAAPAAEAEPSVGGIDFDFGAGEPAAGTAAPALDLSSISLDLGEPTAAVQAAAAGPDSPEVATKLELAQAYEEMGDKDGARELLQEVLKEGGANQQETARARLAKL